VTPYRDTSSASAICPRCTDAPLRENARGSARVFACHACGGLFADRETVMQMLAGAVRELLQLAAEATRAPPRPKLLPVELECPMCERIMDRLQIPDALVPIDICRAHGIWFDRWEAQLVAREISNDATRAMLAEAFSAP
jgi:Zn-finger nucleic acid-binding protein